MNQDQIQVESQDDDVRELTLEESQVVGALAMTESALQ